MILPKLAGSTFLMTSSTIPYKESTRCHYHWVLVIIVLHNYAPFESIRANWYIVLWWEFTVLIPTHFRLSGCRPSPLESHSVFGFEEATDLREYSHLLNYTRRVKLLTAHRMGQSSSNIGTCWLTKPCVLEWGRDEPKELKSWYTGSKLDFDLENQRQQAYAWIELSVSYTDWLFTRYVNMEPQLSQQRTALKPICTIRLAFQLVPVHISCAEVSGSTGITHHRECGSYTLRGSMWQRVQEQDRCLCA